MADDSQRAETRKESSRYNAHLTVYGIALVLLGIGLLVWHTERLRYEIAVKRIELERELAKEAQETERRRIDKAATLAATLSPASSIALGAGGAAGFALLRDLIGKVSPTAGSGAAQGDKRSTSAIASMVDALASAGQIAASEAKSLKDDLQKAGVEIGVDAAKALIDRYIRVHDKPPAGGDKGGVFQGATQVNMYCNAPPVRVSPPAPQSSAPKRSCP